MIRTGVVSQRKRSSEMIGESFDDPTTDRTRRETPAINNAETDLYDELIKNIGNEKSTTAGKLSSGAETEGDPLRGETDCL
ncbi:hypothetical protein ACSBR1_035106 [Camellia fascicularis]